MTLFMQIKQTNAARMVSYHNTAQCHNSQDCDMNCHHHENLRSVLYGHH